MYYPCFHPHQTLTKAHKGYKNRAIESLITLDMGQLPSI